MARKNKHEWDLLIAEAARSGISVSEFCLRHNLPKNLFYRMSKVLGYTSGGKRTAKWEAAAAAPVSCNAVPALVEVPMGIVEGGRFCTPAGPQEEPEVQIMIRYGEFRITVGDHFSSESLRRVLEVVAHA